MHHQVVEAAQVFKALGDPIRLSIVEQIAAEDQLPYSVLDETLSVSKATISYHTKILSQAGIIEVHKRGRNYFYSLRWETLSDLADEIRKLAPDSDDLPELAARVTRSTSQAEPEESTVEQAPSDDSAAPTPLPTW